MLPDAIHAPMPGLIKSVSVMSGQDVIAGDAILVLEAMKMEHTMQAPRDGVVAEVLVTEGDQVADGSMLVRLEASEWVIG